MVRRNPAHRHPVQPGREPIRNRHGQGQRHHQRPSSHGRIGKPGAGPFSLTGQPNAMGGREAGGLANLLAAHLRLDQPRPPRRCAKILAIQAHPAKPGLKAVDMFDAILRGKIKVLWIAATNPAESLPRAGRIRAALESCPFVVVADSGRPRPPGSPTSSSPPPAGAKRTAPSPIPSASFRASAPSVPPPARPNPIGGCSRNSPSAWAMPASATPTPPNFPGARRPFRL